MNQSGCSIDPARVDAHVVGHHVAGQADAARPGAVAQVRDRPPRRPGRPRCGSRSANRREATASGLPRSCLMRCEAWLRSHSPISHRPVKPAAREPIAAPRRGSGPGVQIGRPYCARELVQPDVRALGHQHHARHPVAVPAEALRLTGRDCEAPERGPRGRLRRPRRRTSDDAPPPPPPGGRPA